MGIRTRIEMTQRQLDAARPNIPALDHAYRFQSRNTGVGGNLLACAIAYRLFLWLLPLALVIASLVGFLRDIETESPDDVARELGLSAYVASTVAEQAHSARWLSLAVGLIGVASTSAGAAKTFRTVHLLAWGVDPSTLRKTKGTARLAAGFLSVGVLAVAATAAMSWVREHSDRAGVVVTIASSLLFAAIWLWASARLPHGSAPWTALWPGALLLAAGTLVLHVVTVYYIARKIESASELYGALGSAAAVLLWLYLIGQLIVAGAVLNATMWHARTEREAAVTGT